MNMGRPLASSAFAFVFTMGIVNLFADVTYEGGGAIAGQFLGSLGANALTISVVAGLGEFLGYALRLGSGYAADRTGRYWPLTFIGYAINMLAVPGKRSLAFGLFYAGYGCGWLLGSIAAGFLYQHSRAELALFALLVQFLSIPLFMFGAYGAKQTRRS